MSEIKRAPTENDPNRCQGSSDKGQCNNMATVDINGVHGQFCLAHGGNRHIQKAEKESIRNYNLSKWNKKINDKVNNPALKDLRDEIGILRVVLETTLEGCKDDNDLIMESHKISDLIFKIEKLVVSCHKLEGSMGSLLDKQAITVFAGKMITIIGEEITDEEVLQRVAERILKEI